MTSLTEAINNRHSVRKFTNQKIEEEVVGKLNEAIKIANEESGLNIQLVINEPGAFDSFMARPFKNASNYIALVGKKDDELLEEKCGYFGEKIVILAQTMGLRSCWVALTYAKGKTGAIVYENEKLLMVIALGYGEDDGVARKTKPLDKISNVNEGTPSWFVDGMKAVQLAPTAVNQQKFYFKYENGRVTGSAGSGFYTKTDLGIAKYHFEIGSGKSIF